MKDLTAFVPFPTWWCTDFTSLICIYTSSVILLIIRPSDIWVISSWLLLLIMCVIIHPHLSHPSSHSIYSFILFSLIYISCFYTSCPWNYHSSTVFIYWIIFIYPDITHHICNFYPLLSYDLCLGLLVLF